MELRRPWKLASLAVGLTWLIYGARHYQLADWDVGVSLLMGLLTYLFAPWSVRVILLCLRDFSRDSLFWIAASLAVAWFVVDGVYVAYHGVVGNMMFRMENFLASSALYFLAGSIWLYKGSVRDFSRNIHSFFLHIK